MSTSSDMETDELVKSTQSLQSVESATTESTSVVEEIHSKLTELLEEATTTSTESDAAVRQQLWHRLFELWIDFSKATADVTSNDHAAGLQCLEKISFVCEALGGFKSCLEMNNSEDIQKIFVIFLTMLDLLHVIAHLRQRMETPETILNSLNTTSILSKIVRITNFMSLSIGDIKILQERINLFVALKNYVDLKITLKNENDTSTIDSILGIFVNISDQIVFVPILLEIGLSKSVIYWLSQLDIMPYEISESILTLIYNLARHDDGADDLNQKGAIETIKQCRCKDLVETNVELSLISSMALALLSTPEQLKNDKKGMNNVLNQLLQLTMDAANDDQFRDSTAFHVCEPLFVMVKLFVVDERTLDYILCHAETEPPSDILSTIHLFTSLLVVFRHALKNNDPLEQFTLIATLNILWSISFQPQYALYLRTNNEETMSIITNLAENDDRQAIHQYKPRSMEGIKDAARGILHNLNKETSDTSVQEEDMPNIVNSIPRTMPSHQTLVNSVEKPSIMISYSHTDRQFCRKLVELLSTRCDVFDVWIDHTHCQSVGDLWESIAAGMEQAHIIVCLVSKQYYESKSCRQEFIYAVDTLRKPIVPALLEFKPKGWLGIRMAGAKYVHFKNIEQVDQAKMTDLLETILSSLATPQSKTKCLSTTQRGSTQLQCDKPLATRRKSSCVISTRLSLDQWSSASIDDIKQWFAHHHISVELRDLYNFRTGQEMLRYAPMLLDNFDKQMEIYSRAFVKRYNGDELLPHEFSRFILAMEEVLRQNVLSSVSTSTAPSAQPEPGWALHEILFASIFGLAVLVLVFIFILELLNS